MKNFLPHLGSGTEPLKEAIEKKNYDSALYIIKSFKEKQELSQGQISFLDNLEKRILELKTKQ